MQQTELSELIKKERNLVLLETIKRDNANTKSFLFFNPVEIISASNLSELPFMFKKMEDALRHGYYLAGYLAYECGFHFLELPLTVQTKEPIAWFGVYSKPIDVSKSPLSLARGEQATHHFHPPMVDKQFSIDDVRFTIDDCNQPATLQEYSRKIDKIRWHIQEGDVYQINFTGRMQFDFDGDELALYDSLKHKQRVSYSSFIRTEDQTILSLSPELFFRRDGNRMVVRPMKGTVKRGRTTKEDDELVEWLRNDKKSQAENVMIVDVLRNDLGKISEIGSVKTTSLFEVEKYDTLFQMTSTVEAQLRENISYYEIFKAMFPCGSVTGAPKRRAVELIHELENTPRGIYTGAIGYISPRKEAVFNVAIRTVVLSDPSPTLPFDKGREGTMGTGGGIVWDSNAESEFNECKLKADFLTIPFEEFELIETVLWKNGFQFLDKHLKRLRDSAEFFDFICDELMIREQFTASGLQFSVGSMFKVRLLLHRSGKIEIESFTVQEESTGKKMAAIASERTNSADRFLFHKTTNRKLYDEKFQQAMDEGLADYIFLNEKSEVTEGCISNIFIKKGDTFYTPPLTSGLLNGVYRQHLLETLPKVEEKMLYIEDLKDADSIFLCNAIRGLREVNLKT